MDLNRQDLKLELSRLKTNLIDVALGTFWRNREWTQVGLLRLSIFLCKGR